MKRLISLCSGAVMASAVALLLGDVLSAQPSAMGSPAATFELFSQSEAEAWSNTNPRESTDFSTRDLRDDHSRPTCKSNADNDADNPQIRIVAPALGKPLLAPIDIDLQFVAVGTSHIRPETFRVCYLGLLTMDITKRITDRVAVSEQGLHVSGAQLPSGHHRLVLLIADERGRLGRREAVFNVL